MICLFLLCVCCLVDNVHPKKAQVEYPNEKRHEEYDYIIVGAGSTGAVIASRLSEKNVTVLLLEAGGPPPYESEVPLFAFNLIGQKETEWGYYTEPQVNACKDLDEQKSYWSRYKALGGCSSHNHMIYCRGNRKDYDNWAEMGATGWSFDEVLPFFKMSEDNKDPTLLNNGFHGTGGYLTVSPPSYENKLREAYLEAGKQLGFDIVDYNGPSQTGFSNVQVNQINGFRCSTEKAFLRPAVDRDNLDILIYARVLKIEFVDKTARSVVYVQNNKTFSVTAKKEIILSAGTIGSTHLLLLSGVGPKNDLEAFNISVVSDLPVGQNLQDHIIAGGHAWTVNQSVGIVYDRDVNNGSISEFAVAGTGVLTSSGTYENLAFVFTKYQNESTEWPDLQFHTSSAFIVDKLEHVNEDQTNLLPSLTRPKSRGFIKLRSTDPYEQPILDPRYLSDEDDVLRYIEAIKIGRKIIQTPALQQYDPKPIRNITKGCEGLDYDSDEYIECTIRSLTLTDYHQCCTNRMGDPSKPETVVDPQLKVKGVKGLRVADASVMPMIPSGNLNAACIMIGEKAADMIEGQN